MNGFESEYSFIDPDLAVRDMAAYAEKIVPSLIERFCQSYAENAGHVSVSELRLGPYSYLFDHVRSRMFAAYGNASGQKHGARDKYRQKQYPSKKGSGDDRGHAIAHSAGGGMDINFFPQKASLNRGPFRRLEKLAVAYPGSFYFIKLIYADDSVRPSRIEQGVIVADPHRPRFEFEVFDN